MSFATSPYNSSVLKVRDFMFNDIDKTIKLADNPTVGAPNFLLALGLCCYTEYWGKLLKGVKKGELKRGKEAFNAFLERLDSVYYGGLITSNVDLYGEVRCGLAHAYLIDSKGDAEINLGFGGLHGIDYDKSTQQYVFWVRTYFDEFKAAVNNYVNGLNSGKESLYDLEDSLNGRPELI
jgi:hypothetical protein